MDRIDIHVEVPALPFRDLSAAAAGDSSAALRSRVLAARTIQRERFKRRRGAPLNANMRPRDMHTFCAMTADVRDLLKQAVNDLHFSARAYDRILKVARTIADLEQHETVAIDHIHEAIQYRSLDRQYWV